MPVRRFDANGWRASPFARRGLDLSQFATERAAVSSICARVAADGDVALRELSLQFDGWAPRADESFAVPRPELAAAADRMSSADRAALEFAAQRIRNFHARQVQPSTDGAESLKLITHPVDRAGVYAPGGRAAYPSTVLMTVIPARVANVPEVVLASPPGNGGSFTPSGI